jgi:DNA-binding transcriptional ArsR family regulator
MKYNLNYHRQPRVEYDLTDPHSALVLGREHPIDAVCQSLDSVESFAEWNVLIVSYDFSHDQLRRGWHGRIEGSPANFGTISYVTTDRSRAETTPVSQRSRDIAATVSDPSNLSELGHTISLYLEDWSAGRTLVCFQSLTDSLAHTDPKELFQFLHILTYRIAEVGAVGRFSLDQNTTKEETIRTLEPMFDTVSLCFSKERRTSIDPDMVFDMLRAPRRRYILHRLHERREPTTVSSLANWLTHYEPTADPERIELSLTHSHLPKLENAGLITVTGSRVGGQPDIELLAPYLELASTHDFPD